jgi:hypothetical protein
MSHTTPDEGTVRADERDATKEHSADRPPTEEEAEDAEQLELDPKTAEAYREATERGANVKGEGQIEPD